MKLSISFVVDDAPKFQMQAWNLLNSLKSSGNMDRPETEVFVHHTAGVSSSVLSFYESLGARLVEIEPFGAGAAKYCNKIRQVTSGALDDADVAVLLDADTLVLGDLGCLLETDQIRAKVVDLPNPDLSTLNKLALAAGLDPRVLPRPVKPTFSWFRRTWPANFNGGFYVVPRKHMDALADAWPRWARFCFAHKDILGARLLHSDQLAFALAQLENELPFARLAVEWNFPTHLPRYRYLATRRRDIKLFHYHDRFDNHGRLSAAGIPWIDQQIAVANEMLDAERRTRFSNEIFWNWRYEKDPELGSGVGSRGAVLGYKRTLLRPFFQEFADRPVLDVGCGDLEATRGFKFTDYLGLDSSYRALEMARQKEPDRSFTGEPLDRIENASRALVICLDVLIHLRSAEEYQRFVRHLVRTCSSKLIITGYETEPPNSSAGIVFFHESILDTLSRLERVKSMEVIGEYNNTSVVAVEIEEAAAGQ